MPTSKFVLLFMWPLVVSSGLFPGEAMRASLPVEQGDFVQGGAGAGKKHVSHFQEVLKVILKGGFGVLDAGADQIRGDSDQVSDPAGLHEGKLRREFIPKEFYGLRRNLELFQSAADSLGEGFKFFGIGSARGR